jgi:hypothetical protein
MYKIRYITPKARPPELQPGDTQRVSDTMKHRFPGFGQSPPHPSPTPSRIGLEYSDKYRGDRK